MCNKKVILFFLFLLSITVKAENYTISGYVYDASNGESLIGATVFLKGTTQGTTANAYGFYSLSVSAGKYSVCYTYLGYQQLIKEIDLNKNLTIDIKLEIKTTSFAEVKIYATQPNEEIQSTKMGIIKMPVEKLICIPTIGGEADIIKIMQLMPGVKRGGEGQNGILVRGGTTDQNLVLLDEAIVYNPSHLFGFFSVFNNDALKDVAMIKGGFPANYGGRLSSVMDVKMKEGDMLKYRCDGGIGLLSSRLSIQGPVIKDKMSFIISGRKSYIDKVFEIANRVSKNIKLDIPYSFYDLNGKLNYKIDNNNRIYFSTYYGNDLLKLDESPEKSGGFTINGGFHLINYTNSLRWNHLYNSKLFSNLSLVNTNFMYDVNAKISDIDISIKSKISDLGIKWDFDYYKNSKNKISFGLLTTYHYFTPNVVSAKRSTLETIPTIKSPILASEEFAMYAGSDKTINSALKVNYGVRFSGFFTSDKIYCYPEPRISINYT